MIVSILVIIATFMFMEFMAWATHKYVMHGLMWYFHIDHHQPKKDYKFQRNDVFFIIFAAPAIFLIYLGHENWLTDLRFAMGVGITLYGMAYFLVHEVLIHHRFKWFEKWNNPYLKAIRRAHQAHHSNRGRFDGECFGMLWAPRKYFQEVKSSRYS